MVSNTLLIRPIQIPHVPEPVQRRRRIPKHVAGGGEAFGLGGVDEGEVFGDDLLGVVVEFQAHFVVEFLAGLDVEVVDQGLPTRWRVPVGSGTRGAETRCYARWRCRCRGP